MHTCLRPEHLGLALGRSGLLLGSSRGLGGRALPMGPAEGTASPVTLARLALIVTSIYSLSTSSLGCHVPDYSPCHLPPLAYVPWWLHFCSTHPAKMMIVSVLVPCWTTAC